MANTLLPAVRRLESEFVDGIPRMIGLVAAVSVLGLAGCTSSGSRTTGGSVAPACASGSMVSWSSEEAAPSTFTRAADGSTTRIAQADVKGIVIGSVNRTTIGDHAYFLSQGDIQHDVTHMIDFDRRTCQTRVARLKEVIGPLALATDGTRFITTNTLNAVSHVRRFDSAGVLRAEHAVPGEVIRALVLGKKALYAFAMSLDPAAKSAYNLSVLDPDTLEERDRRPLPDLTSSVESAVLHGDTLIYPLTADEQSNTPRRALVTMDVNTFAAKQLDLRSDLPFILKLDGDVLYVGHTFMNPGFGPIEGLRHVSRVDLKTRAVEGFDVAAGIVDLDVRDGTVVLLGSDGTDADTYLVQTYEGATGKRLTSSTVARQTGGGYYYPAGILAL